MQNGLKAMRPRQRRPAASVVRSKLRTARTAHPSSQNAQRNYERYLTLARAEAQAGNPVAAENYYQHAEHYFREKILDPREGLSTIGDAPDATPAQERARVGIRVESEKVKLCYPAGTTPVSTG
jgi:hypothetical protein